MDVSIRSLIAKNFNGSGGVGDSGDGEQSEENPLIVVVNSVNRVSSVEYTCTNFPVPRVSRQEMSRVRKLAPKEASSIVDLTGTSISIEDDGHDDACPVTVFEKREKDHLLSASGKQP